MHYGTPSASWSGLLLNMFPTALLSAKNALAQVLSTCSNILRVINLQTIPLKKWGYISSPRIFASGVGRCNRGQTRVTCLVHIIVTGFDSCGSNSMNNRHVTRTIEQLLTDHNDRHQTAGQRPL